MIARQTVTHSRRDVIFVVAVCAVQYETRIAEGQVVCQVGGASCGNSDAIARNAVTDHRAPLDIDAGAGSVDSVTTHDSSDGVDPVVATGNGVAGRRRGKQGQYPEGNPSAIRNGVPPHDSSSNYPRPGTKNAQSLDDGALSPPNRADTDPLTKI